MLWDTFNSLRATITDQWIWFIAAVVLVVLVVLGGMVTANKFYKSKPYEPVEHKQDGWTATGRVDFIDLQSTGNFVLQAEDTRVVDGIGGVDHREIRWRRATLDEARTVVIAFHAQRNLAMTANFIVSAPIRRRSGMDNEQQETLLGNDEAPDGKSQG
jgi:hypothetical protein